MYSRSQYSVYRKVPTCGKVQISDCSTPLLRNLNDCRIINKYEKLK